jgi:hypothetical protein
VSCVLLVRKCVLYYCHQVATQLQLNISYQIDACFKCFCKFWEGKPSHKHNTIPSDHVQRLTFNQMIDQSYQMLFSDYLFCFVFGKSQVQCLGQKLAVVSEVVMVLCSLIRKMLG